MTTGTSPFRLALPRRALVLVAGMPGAGKSTLLAGLPPDPRVVVLDSDAQRAALGRTLSWLPYRHYRWLVHLLHRWAVLRAAVSRVPVVVVHLPATDPAARVAVAVLAALTGRGAHLLWLDVDPADALRGQAHRGRVVPDRSFHRHAAAATRIPIPSPGWAGVTVLDRARARAGLALDPPVRHTPAPAQ
ncbi:MAG: AAA family ATPase [Pseudonocardia sp.]|nr:AAA family ATPase [Pseudonocardia sp.]